MLEPFAKLRLLQLADNLLNDLSTNGLQMIGITPQPGRWYGWRSIEATSPQSDPFACSPVFVTAVAPLADGASGLRIDLIIALHPITAVRAVAELTTAQARAEAPATMRDGGDGMERTGALEEVDFAWMARHCATFFRCRPARPDIFGNLPAIEAYLHEALGRTEAEILSGATAESFGTRSQPMPLLRTSIVLDRTFSGFDAYLVGRGLVPLSMEDKWFIHLQDGTLFMRRTWTGACVYEVAVEWRGQDLHVGHAVVNRDPAQYRETNDDRDREMVLFLIERLLLGRPVPFPNGDHRGAQAAAAQWSHVGRSMLDPG